MTKTSLFPLLAALLASPVMAQDAQLHWMDLEGMTPSEIGERALDGLDHGEIVEVEYRRQGMAPPGIHEVQLRELTEREAQGKEADLYRSPPPRVSSPYLSPLSSTAAATREMKAQQDIGGGYGVSHFRGWKRRLPVGQKLRR